MPYLKSDAVENYSEWKHICKKLEEHTELDKLYSNYHENSTCMEKYDEYIEVRDISFITCELLKSLQEYMLKKGIAIETLPTSNYRISQYIKFEEYHIERWINTNSTYNPIVVIGTDDPGIFNTNIYNEYAKVFLYWKRMNYPVGDIMRKIRDIHKNSENYSFK